MTTRIIFVKDGEKLTRVHPDIAIAYALKMYKQGWTPSDLLDYLQKIYPWRTDRMYIIQESVKKYCMQKKIDVPKEWKEASRQKILKAGSRQQAASSGQQINK